MGKFLRGINGVPRMVEESPSIPIYDETLYVVSSGAGAGEINGPIAASTAIALPDSKTYTGDELEVRVNGSRMTLGYDYVHESSTEISFTFEIAVGDYIRFRIDRSA